MARLPSPPQQLDENGQPFYELVDWSGLIMATGRVLLTPIPKDLIQNVLVPLDLFHEVNRIQEALLVSRVLPGKHDKTLPTFQWLAIRLIVFWVVLGNNPEYALLLTFVTHQHARDCFDHHETAKAIIGHGMCSEEVEVDVSWYRIFAESDFTVLYLLTSLLDGISRFTGDSP